MKSWDINPNTGDYTVTRGAPVESGNLQLPAYYRLKIKRGQWMYAPNNVYGSNLYLLKKNQASKSARAVEQASLDALQPILDDGRAETIDVLIQESSRHGLGVQINILDNAGDVERFVFEGLGV